MQSSLLVRLDIVKYDPRMTFFGLFSNSDGDLVVAYASSATVRAFERLTGPLESFTEAPYMSAFKPITLLFSYIFNTKSSCDTIWDLCEALLNGSGYGI